MKKWFLGVSLVLASVSHAEDYFQGEYNQPTQFQVQNGKVNLTENMIAISLVTDVPHTYYLQISVIGPDSGMCEMAEEAQIDGHELVYRSGINSCEIRVNKDAAGWLQVRAQNCEDQCGSGVGPDGTGKGFKKINGGQAITRDEEHFW